MNVLWTRCDLDDGSQPEAPGLYCAEVFYGWKLLEFHDGEWWHPNKVGRWTAGVPKQWVGPMPELIGGDPLPKAGQEYDL